MKKNLPIFVFIIVSLLDFIGILTQNPLTIAIAKPLIIPSLIWYYYSNSSKRNSFLITGLFFSFLGDVFLLSDEEHFFILGLCSFLIAHILYISMLSKMIRKPKSNTLIKASIPFVLLFIFLINLLYNSLGELKIPVIIYAITISLFGIISLIYFLQKRNIPALLLLIGVISFIFSDAILAVNLFYSPKAYFPILIMTTYVLAQFLICKFVLNYKPTR